MMVLHPFAPVNRGALGDQRNSTAPPQGICGGVGL